MADQKITTPSGMGGLQRFDEEYPSKIQISPEMVTIFIGIIIIAMALIKYFIKIY